MWEGGREGGREGYVWAVMFKMFWCFKMLFFSLFFLFFSLFFCFFSLFFFVFFVLFFLFICHNIAFCGGNVLFGNCKYILMHKITSQSTILKYYVLCDVIYGLATAHHNKYINCFINCCMGGKSKQSFGMVYLLYGYISPASGEVFGMVLLLLCSSEEVLPLKNS